jgi:hypothetical protein
VLAKDQGEERRCTLCGLLGGFERGKSRPLLHIYRNSYAYSILSYSETRLPCDFVTGRDADEAAFHGIDIALLQLGAAFLSKETSGAHMSSLPCLEAASVSYRGLHPANLGLAANPSTKPQHRSLDAYAMLLG